MATPTDAHCRNCGTPLYGEHCYACGQPTKGLVRHLREFAGDAVDALFDLDSRLLRTLPALLLRPGFLSNEYIEGHRVRYVSPVRLFVVLCIATFFAAKLATPSFEIGRDDAVRVSGTGEVFFNPDVDEGFETFDSVDAVEARLEEIKAERAEARRLATARGRAATNSDAALEAAAAKRIAELEASEAPEGTAAAATRGAEAGTDGLTISFNDEPWDPETNPVAFDTLPETANDWINAQIGHVPENWKRIREDPDLLRNAFYSALPTLLFVLVPVFAGLLKGLYLFKRRMYMEHLVVALHGHAFVCAALLILMGTSALESLLGAPAWLAAPLGWLEWALVLWVPVYLWLLLKRVYGQGVWMTTLCFGLLGLAELVLLGVVATGALLSALVWL